jgi:hypothetical protein
VAPSRIGERVIVDFSIYNSDGESLADIDYIGHGRDGGFAEYVTVPAENAYETLSAYSDPELATFCCAYPTAEQMLARAGVKAGERVLIMGASAGARLFGAFWATSRVGELNHYCRLPTCSSDCCRRKTLSSVTNPSGRLLSSCHPHRRSLQAPSSLLRKRSVEVEDTRRVAKQLPYRAADGSLATL